MDRTEAGTALTPVRDMLRADGYDVEVEHVSDERLDVRVVAGPDACDDCLVPKDVLSMIIKDSLPDGAPATVNVAYPTDS